MVSQMSRCEKLPLSQLVAYLCCSNENRKAMYDILELVSAGLHLPEYTEQKVDCFFAPDCKHLLFKTLSDG